MSKIKKYDLSDIRTLDTREVYRRRLFQPAEIDPLYVLMGGFLEYFGGYHLDEEGVERFFVGEFEKAQVFEAVCHRYLKSLGSESDVELVKSESGHSYIRSRLICSKLKEHYTERQPDFLRHQCFLLSDRDNLYQDVERDSGHWYNFKRYSFLLGALIRNKMPGKKDICFYNANHKVALIIQILNEFSAFGDHSFKVTYFFGVPLATRISLSPKNEIWGEIDKFKKSLSL